MADRARAAFRAGAAPGVKTAGQSFGVPAETLPRSRRVGTFVLLLGAEFLYGWSWSTVDVLRPQLRASVGATLSELGARYSVQAFGALLGAVTLGQLGDRLGRRNVLSVILARFGVLLISGAFIADYRLLLAQRMAMGFFMGGAQPLVSSIYLGLFPAHLRGKLASGVNAVFTLSVVALGAALALLRSGDDWHWLLWIGGGAGIALAPAIRLFVPDDRQLVSFGQRRDAAGAHAGTPLRAMFDPALRRLTLIIAFMAGCNYFATQAFQGWTSTYLSTDRGLAQTSVGAALAWQASGSLIGGFFWGWFGDRFGRRSSALGYVLGLFMVAIYVLMLRNASAFIAVGFLVGFGLAASVIWAPWVAELFPDRLRATALSVFNWGRIVSLIAPLATGAIAERWSLSVAMLLALPALLVVILLWRSLPETVQSPSRAARLRSGPSPRSRRKSAIRAGSCRP